MAANPFRVLPSINSLNSIVADRVGSGLSSPAITALLQSTLEEFRHRIVNGECPSREQIIASAIEIVLCVLTSRLSPVINGTGVILHTNLGRAPVSLATAKAMAEAASEYVALEIDPVSNDRGARMDEITLLMRLLTKAEACLVVNNNAAAILLSLAALAAGGEVIVSRGEAVEIGGGFRIPDVLRQSGATLIDVGTTNRTRVEDYIEAITSKTRAVLKVHPSNFRLQGFVESAGTAELAAALEKFDVPLIEDLGSGAIVDSAQFGLAAEPTVGMSIASGVSIVTASGDKLLGGPQAGIVAGKAHLVEQIGTHPLARAVRADKTCLAGVAATLRHYVVGDWQHDVPVWQMISTSVEALGARANQLRSILSLDNIELRIAESLATVGGGSLPGETLPSRTLVFDGRNVSDLPNFARRMRTGQPAVFARIERDALLIDLRTVRPENDNDLADAIRNAWPR